MAAPYPPPGEPGSRWGGVRRPRSVGPIGSTLGNRQPNPGAPRSPWGTPREFIANSVGDPGIPGVRVIRGRRRRGDPATAARCRSRLARHIPHGSPRRITFSPRWLAPRGMLEARRSMRADQCPSAACALVSVQWRSISRSAVVPIDPCEQSALARPHGAIAGALLEPRGRISNGRSARSATAPVDEIRNCQRRVVMPQIPVVTLCHFLPLRRRRRCRSVLSSMP